jgi:hypothetical protein
MSPNMSAVYANTHPVRQMPFRMHIYVLAFNTLTYLAVQILPELQ